MSSLAVKYRPEKFEDLCEQASVVKMLNNMIQEGTFPNCMMFTGAAGTGKTTSARIMANMINKGQGKPIEIDAASNNSVDNIRSIIQESKHKSLDSEYKVYILDEVHALSSTAWQAALKLIEEPPAKTVFIFCTTDPQKIPNTIHSRVQRFNFNRITYEGTKSRLIHIIQSENKEGNSITYTDEAISYIAKMADGGMRDAITFMEKCLNYSNNLTVENVVTALGVQDYSVLFSLLKSLIARDQKASLVLIDNSYLDGKDMKQFIKQVVGFMIDVCKYMLLHDFKYIDIPETYKGDLDLIDKEDPTLINYIRTVFVNLQNDSKWDSKPKLLLSSLVMDICRG